MVNETFYVALFEDTECTQGVSKVKKLTYKNASTSITPVKTGDNTPIMVMILLFAASALIIMTVTVRKRKSK